MSFGAAYVSALSHNEAFGRACRAGDLDTVLAMMKGGLMDEGLVSST
jgi:hypothetical protein